MSDNIQEIIDRVAAFNSLCKSSGISEKTQELIDLEVMIAEVLSLRQQVNELQAENDLVWYTEQTKTKNACDKGF